MWHVTNRLLPRPQLTIKTGNLFGMLSRKVAPLRGIGAQVEKLLHAGATGAPSRRAVDDELETVVDDRERSGEVLRPDVRLPVVQEIPRGAVAPELGERRGSLLELGIDVRRAGVGPGAPVPETDRRRT